MGIWQWVANEANKFDSVPLNVTHDYYLFVDPRAARTYFDCLPDQTSTLWYAVTIGGQHRNVHEQNKSSLIYWLCVVAGGSGGDGDKADPRVLNWII